MRRGGLPLALAAAIGAAALARLTVGGRAWLPLLVTAVVAEVVAGLALARLDRARATALGTAAFLLSAVWTTVPGATRLGLPTPTTVRSLHHALAAARPVLAGLHPPFDAVTGVAFLGALVAGAAGVAVAVFPGAPALLAPLALVGWSTIALPSTGAAVLGVLLALAGMIVLAAPDRPGRAAPLIGTAAVVAAALCALVVATTASAGGAGRAGPGAAGGPAVTADAWSLVTELTGLETHDPDLVLFTARTDVPSYWQVTSLTVFAGGVWQPDAATDNALLGAQGGVAPSGAGPGSRAPSGSSSYGADVTIDAFASRLVPAPPGTTADDSSFPVTDQGVVAPWPTTAGQHYGLTVELPGPMGAGPPVLPADVAADLRLPPLPPAVVALAHQITAPYHSALQKAEALTGWFRSGRFRYSLTAAPTSLVDFLTTTRVGSCQQFAGGFALLARAAGLPARVAVGFTTGHLSPGGLTVIRGVDAHAWPQVDVDGTWLSFEPTPERPSGELAPADVLGPAGLGTPNPDGSTHPTHLTLPHPAPVTPTTAPHRAGRSSPSRHGRSVAAVTAAGLGAAALVLALAVGVPVWRRRRRRRARAAGQSPTAAVRAAWSDVDRALARSGLGRPPWRTPTTHVHVLLALLAAGTPDDELGTALGEAAWLAALLEATSYAGTRPPPDDAVAARQAAARIVGVLRRRRDASAALSDPSSAPSPAPSSGPASVPSLGPAPPAGRSGR